MADFKACASRALNLDEKPTRRWAREGSTRRLLNAADIASAVRYVAEGQGEPMAVFVATRGTAFESLAGDAVAAD